MMSKNYLTLGMLCILPLVVALEPTTVSRSSLKFKTWPTNNPRSLQNESQSLQLRMSAATLARQSAAESRRLNPFRLMLSKPRVSPLYLINGTVCRFVNFQPVCTVLSTTGLSVGPGGASAGGGGGSGSGGAGAGGGGGGATTARPAAAGVSSGGSSVQFASQPARRVAAASQAEPLEILVERRDNATNEPPSQTLAIRPVQIARRPVGLLSFGRRPPSQYLNSTPSQVRNAPQKVV